MCFSGANVIIYFIPRKYFRCFLQLVIGVLMKKERVFLLFYLYWP